MWRELMLQIDEPGLVEQIFAEVISLCLDRQRLSRFPELGAFAWNALAQWKERIL